MPPIDPSGVRVGTPAVAALGMDEAEMKEISTVIGQALRGASDEASKSACRARVAELMSRFPVYRD
jgi:glycine hydroxymethyltransferase